MFRTSQCIEISIKTLMHIHHYEIVGETHNAIVEVCKECKKRLVTKQDKKGRIDNRIYLREHVADTCQPTGTTSKIFAKVYGKPKK